MVRFLFNRNLNAIVWRSYVERNDYWYHFTFIEICMSSYLLMTSITIFNTHSIFIIHITLDVLRISGFLILKITFIRNILRGTPSAHSQLFDYLTSHPSFPNISLNLTKLISTWHQISLSAFFSEQQSEKISKSIICPMHYQ